MPDEFNKRIFSSGPDLEAVGKPLPKLNEVFPEPDMLLDQVQTQVGNYMHQPVNVFAETGTDLPYLYGTWFHFDEPGMDGIMVEAGDSLDPFFEKFQLKPVSIARNTYVFVSRYEFPKYCPDTAVIHGIEVLSYFRYADAIFENDTIGFVDYLSGFPFDCIETIGFIGEFYDDPEAIPTRERTWEPIPLLPKSDLFFGFRGYIGNLKGASSKKYRCKLWTRTLEATPKPENLHFWLRMNMDGSEPYPVPGEFVVMCCRIFSNQPWGTQGTHPYAFSGNWLDTLFYSHAKIVAITEPTEERPYNWYNIKRRAEFIPNVIPTDFAQYSPEDEDGVAILKDPAPTRLSLTWEEDRLFDPTWRVGHVVFYQE